jgi:hypothetical protein
MSEVRCPRCQAVLAGADSVCAACLVGGGDEPVVLAGALELEDPIGEGGMGQVFRARHRRLNRTVAVKFLPAELAGDEEFRRRFEREAQALARLNHPGIVTLHDFGEEDGQYYLVMEFAEGGTLATSMPVGEVAAVRHALAIADALAYAHARGIVHRDIKPPNVLLDGEGRAKLTDFGIARFFGPHSDGWTVTRPDRVSGTPLYMAPEAIDGAAPDPRQDLYSLGVLLYEMVTGQRPAGDFAPLNGPLDAIVRKLLAPDPANRYATALEVRAALESLDRKPSPATAGDLPEEEIGWLRAVCVLLSVCTAVGLWALLLCLTPRVMAPGDVMPLIMLDVKPLPDGRVVSWARFEIGPLLAAFFAFGVGAAAQGALRAHWRRSGLIAAAPDQPLFGSRVMIALGVLACGMYAFRKTIEAFGARTLPMYMPIAGGLVEIAVVYTFWETVMEARRRQRPLPLEPKLWLGLALALMPPVVDLMVYLSRWQP